MSSEVRVDVRDITLDFDETDRNGNHRSLSERRKKTIADATKKWLEQCDRFLTHLSGRELFVLNTFDKVDNVKGLRSDPSPVVFQLFDLIGQKQKQKQRQRGSDTEKVTPFFDSLTKGSENVCARHLNAARSLHIQEVDTITRKAPPVLRCCILLYRGTSVKYASQTSTRQTYTHPEFHAKLLAFERPRSFSLDREIALAYASKEKNGVLLVFHMAPGSRALPLFYLDENPYEKEVVFPSSGFQHVFLGAVNDDASSVPEIHYEISPSVER